MKETRTLRAVRFIGAERVEKHRLCGNEEYRFHSFCESDAFIFYHDDFFLKKLSLVGLTGLTETF